MANFAERYGHRPRPAIFQIDGISDELRITLWNAFYLFTNSFDEHDSILLRLIKWHRLLIRKPVDDIPYQSHYINAELKKYFLTAAWFDIFDYLEKFFPDFPSWIDNRSYTRGSIFADFRKFKAQINVILKEHASGYTLFEDQFVPIITEGEIQSIGDVLDETQKHGLEGANTHFRSAISFLSAKPHPDYRNSIKESISAVESVAKILSGTPDGGLSKSLGILSKKVPIHGGLVGGMNAIYGYTSDADGIRHPILDDGALIDLADAKYMLVSCSAFVSFLVQKGRDAGLFS
ncbi:MAG: hypothetical protein IPK50_01435 [Fibrobacterota bacterium]|nr:MAG: hypothetical protein IPK50_01435 [Fibrobacterota bacterium]